MEKSTQSERMGEIDGGSNRDATDPGIVADAAPQLLKQNREGRDELIEGLFDAKPAFIRTNISMSHGVLTRMLCKAKLTAQDCVGQRLLVRGYFLSYGDLPPDSETGEVGKGYTLTLLLHDGVTLATSSPTFVQSFGRIVALLGKGEWQSPVPIRIIAHKRSKGAGQWLQCYIADTEAD